MSTNKPTDKELNKLIDDLAIDFRAMRTTKAQLRETAKGQDDPAGFLRDIANGQKERQGDDTPNAEVNEATNDGEETTSDDDNAEENGEVSEHVRSGDELARQSEQVFCPACSDESKNQFVVCKAISSPRRVLAFTIYRCPNKGCSFQKKVLRKTLAKAFSKYREATQTPNVNARE